MSKAEIQKSVATLTMDHDLDDAVMRGKPIKTNQTSANGNEMKIIFAKTGVGMAWDVLQRSLNN